MNAGDFATSRRGFDSSDAEYVLTQMRRQVPDGAIARMMGRSLADVCLVTNAARGQMPCAISNLPALPVPAKPKRRREPLDSLRRRVDALPPPVTRKPPPEGTMASCVWWAAQRHGVSTEAMMSRNASRAVAFARHEAMWEAYQVRLSDGSRKFGRPRIGLYFHRDRQTVWAAIKAHARRASSRLAIVSEAAA